MLSARYVYVKPDFSLVIYAALAQSCQAHRCCVCPNLAYAGHSAGKKLSRISFLLAFDSIERKHILIKNNIAVVGVKLFCRFRSWGSTNENICRPQVEAVFGLAVPNGRNRT